MRSLQCKKESGFEKLVPALASEQLDEGFLGKESAHRKALLGLLLLHSWRQSQAQAGRAGRGAGGSSMTQIHTPWVLIRLWHSACRFSVG